MKAIVALLSFSPSLATQTAAQAKDHPTTLRGILLEQLRTTHSQKDWFVPVNIAVEGLTPKPGPTVKAITPSASSPIIFLFWDTDQRARFKGETPPKYSGDNNETFNNFDSKNWGHRPPARCSPHPMGKRGRERAQPYHIGQIIYIRKQQGWSACCQNVGISSADYPRSIAGCKMYSLGGSSHAALGTAPRQPSCHVAFSSSSSSSIFPPAFHRCLGGAGLSLHD
jgi:hypothetical protein